MSCPLTIAPSLSRILVMIGDVVNIDEEAVLRLGNAKICRIQMISMALEYLRYTAAADTTACWSRMQ